jgi:4-hydroxy-tetrahydrodipicolinate synthase
MFTGCGTALVTPFRRDLSLDEETLRAWSAGRSTPASTSWFPAAPPAKAPRSPAPSICAWSEIALEEARGKVPVLAGAGGYNTSEVIELARELERLGADGILSVTPYYNKPTQEGLYQHYRPSPPPSACPSWCTACRAAPA